MFNLIRLFLKQDLKNNYFSKWYVLTDIIALITSLFIYWLTSKALSPHLSQNLNWYQTDYFTYVVVGEAFMLIPLQALNAGARSVKGLIMDNILETIICLPGAVSTIIQSMLFSSLARDFVYMWSMLLISKLFLGLNIEWHTIVYAHFTLIIFLPGFIGLGLISSSIVLYFGRGQGALNHFSAIISVLSGVYFPITIFEEVRLDSFFDIFPFTIYLESIRKINNHQNLEFHIFIYAIIFGLIGYLSGLCAIKKALNLLRKKGLHIFTFY
ncbi:MAG: hypothetical protein KDD58_05080 [Bdellovibrionales bacterium]|nr:hypothetical protein [Bdellovibrionales bacterium]